MDPSRTEHKSACEGQVQLSNSKATFRSLFKFKPIDCYLDKLLTNAEIYFSGPQKLNDPSEGLLRFTAQQKLVDDGNAPSITEPKDDASYSSVHNTYYFCLTTSNTSIPMWSYYGGSHSGVCLEFDFSNAVEVNPTYAKRPWLIGTGSMTPRISVVNYQKHLEEYVLAPNGDPILGPDQQDQFGLSKLSCWEHEREVRLSLNRNPAESLQEALPPGMPWPFDKNRLTSIYFGLKTPPAEKQRILKLARAHKYNCAFFEAYEIAYENNNHAIKFRPYEE